MAMEEQTAGAGTLARGLQARAAADPLGGAMIHLKDGETESRRVNWHELDLAARSVAAKLGEHCGPGERALLLYRRATNPG